MKVLIRRVSLLSVNGKLNLNFQSIIDNEKKGVPESNTAQVGMPTINGKLARHSLGIEPQLCYPRKIDQIIKNAIFIAHHRGMNWFY